MKYERAWLAVGWCALGVFLFYAVTQAFPTVVEAKVSGESGYSRSERSRG